MGKELIKKKDILNEKKKEKENAREQGQGVRIFKTLSGKFPFCNNEQAQSVTSFSQSSLFFLGSSKWQRLRP